MDVPLTRQCINLGDVVDYIDLFFHCPFWGFQGDLNHARHKVISVFTVIDNPSLFYPI